MLIDETVQPRQIIFVVQYFGLWVFVRGEFHKILSLLLAEFNARSLQMAFHLFDFDVTLPFGVQEPESSQYSFGIIRFELLLFKNCIARVLPLSI
jgi:hypothetical protein